MKYIIILVLLNFALSLTAISQVTYAKNQKVEVEWKGKWYKATILETKGKSYKVHYDGYASSNDEVVPTSRIRTIATANTTASNSKTNRAAIKYGKYGCTASAYRNGSYEYLAKGSLLISKTGKYTYLGFEKPSTGTFQVDANGVISFKGGYLDKGQATPIEDRENRYYLVFPTIPDGRWTCGLIEEE